MDYCKALRITLLFLLTLTAAGCGNKGDLFLPSDPPADQQTEEDESGEDGEPES
jgi:predicted small lipoprotein YifL